MNDKGVLLEIRRKLPSLPQQERKVGEYVLELPHEAVGHSITTLASSCGVSSTTVSRFCRRIGLKGYRNFRIALAKEWGSPENLLYVNVQPGDTLATVTQKIFVSNIRALRDTQKLLDLRILEQVVDAILQARRVDIYAIGGASIAARELHFKSMHLGINANAFLDSQMQVMSAASLTQDDVGIGISHSGMQRHVVEALELASGAGATTIALTSYPGSLVAKTADMVLFTASLDSITSHDSPSVRNAQLAVVDVIYEAMVIKGQNASREKMARVTKAISGHMMGSSGEI